MSLETLKQADMVLSPCGRPQPPPGYRWVDLPYVISLAAQLPNAMAGTPAHLDVTLGEVFYFTLTAVTPGVGGNSISFAVTGVGTPNLSLAVSVIADAISVQVATDSGGVSTSVGQDIVNALLATPAVVALVGISNNFGFASFFFQNFSHNLFGGSGSAPVVATTNAFRVENKARVPFLCRGFSVRPAGQASFRIWWSNGRNLEQQVLPSNFAQSGAGLRTLMPEVMIPSAGKMTIEISPTSIAAGQLFLVYFWGVLRYLLKGDGSEPRPYTPDVSRAPRVPGTSNQNIFAPEWRLGNQCCPETPPGYRDEPYTLYSVPIANPVGDTTVGVPVEIPADCDFFICKNIQYDSVKDDTVTSGVAALQIRLPSGYSLTNGDYLPDDWTGPVFPTLPVSGGGRYIIDAGDMDATGTGDITTTVQFDGCKRIKVSA